MSPWVVAEAVWMTVTAPMLCRLHGHDWHVWRLHCNSLLVCQRCGHMA